MKTPPLVRVANSDIWHTPEKKVWLKLTMDTPDYPWRVGINGQWWNRKFMTPAGAFKLATEKMKAEGDKIEPCEIVV